MYQYFDELSEMFINIFLNFLLIFEQDGSRNYFKSIRSKVELWFRL